MSKLIPIKSFEYYFAEITELQEKMQSEIVIINREVHAEKDLSTLRNRLEMLNAYKCRLSYLTPFVHIHYDIKLKEVTIEVHKKLRKNKSAAYVKGLITGDMSDYNYLVNVTERLSSQIELLSRTTITEVSSLTKELQTTMINVR
ncbi:MAG: hypothetical protein WC358_00020 [Ignavibacteria bacterium]